MHPKYLLNGINDLPPIQIASFEGMDKRLCGSNIRCHGNVMNIAESKQIHFVRFMGLWRKGVSEKEEKVDFVAGYTCADLLVAAL